MNLTPEWQAERSLINHSWLKNDFITHLTSLAVLPEDSRNRKNVANNMEQWNGQIKRLQKLIDTIEHDMSPARLFEQAPLCRLADQYKAWMVPLLHESWLEKNDIPGIKADMEAGLERIQHAFSAFEPKFERGNFTSEDVRAFARSCQDYSEYLSTLRDLSVLP